MADFLYIHIPFCMRKCLYCDFLSIVFDDGVAERYIDSLCSELRIRAKTAGTLRTVYIGGGTPSLLSRKCMKKLFSCLREHYTFSPEAEITLEANPGTIDPPKIELLLSCGINRVSLGIQSLHDEELRTLGRIHTSQSALRALAQLKAAGANNISVDLMYGIPGQTLSSWRETLERIIGNSPGHISTYELTPERKTPLFDLIGSGALLLPEEDIVLGMYHKSIGLLSASGYGHYEISNFALSGFRSVHNLNYWNRGEYIGAGAGAHSFMSETRSVNKNSIPEYINDLVSGNLPVESRTPVTRDEAKREFLFLGLRKTEGFPLRQVSGPARDLALQIEKTCEALIEDNYLEIAEDSCRLSRKGLAVSNAVIVDMFGRLGL